MTSLHKASEGGNVDVVRMLLERGADVHPKDDRGKFIYLSIYL